MVLTPSSRVQARRINLQHPDAGVIEGADRHHQRVDNDIGGVRNRRRARQSAVPRRNERRGLRRYRFRHC